jgi:glycosyltransferase involved in cell wall biosynthesis
MFLQPPENSVRKTFTGKTVMGFVGSLKPWHGIDLLVDSFRALAEDPVYHLLVVGDGPMMKALRKVERQFPGRVTLTGSIPHSEVPRYVHAIDVAVAPYEPLENFYFCPLKILEYMACGRAIVATRIGQIGDLLRHSCTAWLVEPGDRLGFVEAVRTVTRSPGLREKLGRAAAAEARSYHTWKHRAASIVALSVSDRGQTVSCPSADTGAQ